MSLLTQASLIVTPNAVKASKLYSIIPSNGDGDMDVVRATTATRVNSAGLIENIASNVPRLNYDVAGGCPSILVEPQRTNLNLYSDDFGNSYWTLFQSARSVDVTISPSGIQNADKLIENNTTNPHSIFINSSFSVTIGQTYTRSVYAKADGRNWISLLIIDNTQFRAFFDLQNGVIGNVTSGITASIQNVGNGWYRCSITRTTASITISSMAIELASSNGVNSYLGNGTSGVYLWGAQLEAGAYSTSYIPTTTASVTRNADAISKTGISDLIGQTEGTFFIDFQNKVNEITTGLVVRMLYSITDGTNNNRFSQSIIRTPTRNYTDISIRSNNVLVSNINVDTPTGRFKIAVSYKIGATKMFINGVLVGNVGLSEIPIINRLFLGCSTSAGAENGNVGINTFLTVKTALTDSECIALTTL